MRQLYRGGVLIACLVACLTVVGTAASAASFPVSVSARADAFTADIGCCVESTISDPFTLVVPRLGRLTAVADLDVCGSACEPNGFTIFSIQFTSPSGGTFVLIGSADGGNLSNLSGRGTWSVLDTGPFAPSGRFSHVVGSGTWSAAATIVGPHVEPSDGPSGADSILALSLTGTLTLKS
jgi:hypothetical protein